MHDGLVADVERARGLAEELGGSFYRPRIFAWDGFLAVRAGERAQAKALFEEGLHEAGDAELDVVWNSWIELLAAEMAGGSNELRAAASHLAEGAGDDAPGMAEWASYATALALAREETWDDALAGAAVAATGADARGDRMLEWRALALQADALAELRRTHASAAARIRTRRLVGSIAATAADDASRASFLARPLVSRALGSVDGWFAELADEELEALVEAAEVVLADAGSRVHAAGAPAERVFAVDAGIVELSADGVSVATVVAGETFGEEALAGEPAIADAVARGSVRVLAWPVERFASTLAASSRTADRLLAVLGRRVQAPELLQLRPSAARGLMGAIETVAQRGRGDGVVEVFPVLLEGGTFRWLRPVDTRGPLQLAATADEHPGATALEELRRRQLVPLAVHSTSWRTEGDRVVLTYLAVVEGGAEGWEVDDVVRTELARGTATDAPARIEVAHVIEHGLRHLSWLARDDPVIRDLLSRDWKRGLSGYTPEPFRTLGQSFVATS
jgi:CRP-like cAMP-binding protein